MQQTTNINKYIINFTLGYVIGLIALTIIFHFLNLENNSGASIGVLIGAAMFSAGKFIQDHKRVPDKKEKSRLVWTSLAISWLVSIVLLIASVLIFDGQQGLNDLSLLIQELNALIITGIIVFLSLIQFLVLSFSYGYLAQKQYTGLKKRGKI